MAAHLDKYISTDIATTLQREEFICTDIATTLQREEFKAGIPCFPCYLDIHYQIYQFSIY